MGPEDQTDSELTFGEIAVGYSFNPSGNADVQKIKSLCAQVIDLLNNRETVSKLQLDESNEAINQLKTAQMWAVKAVTRGL